MKKVRLSAAARQEFFKEVAYYETTRMGLGGRFRRAVTAVFRRLASNGHSQVRRTACTKEIKSH